MVSEHASPLAMLGASDAGGQNVHVAALAQALARRGTDVLVYTRRDDARLPRRVRMGPGVTVVHVDAGPPTHVFRDDLLPYMDRFADELHRAWRRDRPDVVHAHFWMSGRASLAAAERLSLPVVQTFHALGVVKRRHQGDADTSPAERIDAERTILDRASRIIATSSDEVFELARMGGDTKAIAVVPCGVDLSAFRPDGPPWPRTPGRPRIAVVSRLVERKGLGDVIAALARVPRAELLIAGGPDRRALCSDAEARRLLQLARTSGVDHRVEMLGRIPREDVPALLRSADVVPCVPWYEPFGMVALEAMACGVPVVASAVGGLVDTVIHGETGIHVPPRHPARLAQALRTLLTDHALRRHFGTAAVNRARLRYGWERIAASTLSVYSDAIRRGAPTLEEAGR
jgi:glycosyltransferase involved in cell wall biosynthesis